MTLTQMAGYQIEKMGHMLDAEALPR